MIQVQGFLILNLWVFKQGCEFGLKGEHGSYYTINYSINHVFTLYPQVPHCALQEIKQYSFYHLEGGRFVL